MVSGSLRDNLVVCVSSQSWSAIERLISADDVEFGDITEPLDPNHKKSLLHHACEICKLPYRINKTKSVNTYE